jgi:hypothetical protein
MTASLKQLCLEKLCICEFDRHSLPEHLHRDLSAMDYNECLNEIRKNVQEYDSQWIYEGDPHLIRIYHNVDWYPKWSWVAYRSLSELRKHTPVIFIRSSSQSLGKRPECLNKRPEKKRRMYYKV